MIKNQRGSALLVVAGIIVVLSVIVDAVMVNYDSNMKTLEAFSGKRQAFYVSEGVRALVTVIIEDYLMSNPSPDSAALSAHLDTTLAPLVPAPYTVSPIQVSILKTTPSSTISSGPFKGMNGPITDLSVRFNVLAPSSVFTGNIVEPLELRLAVGYISMFQFMAFFDTNNALLSTGPEMEMLGRLHSNGDLCVGGSSGYENFLKLTVGGRLMSNADARCGGGGGTSRTRIATNPNNFIGSLEMTNATDNGCANCAGTGLNWEAFALARWREQAQDTAHGVQILKLPGAGAGLVQLREAGNNSLVQNTDNLRFIIDPVLLTDSASVRTYKYAFNADIRIINGVWYIKDPLNPNLWPGRPIWSDHPGSYTETINGVAIPVGQEDIRADWAATRPWPAAPAMPGGFSYYEYDQVAESLFDTAADAGVLSYGNLVNAGGVNPHRVAHWVNALPGTLPGNTSSLCDAGEALTCAGGCGLLNVQTAVTCTPGVGPATALPIATKVLNSTRGGFRNGHIYSGSTGGAGVRAARSRVLPINFDVSQFQAMLANNDPGELGSYFGVTGYKGSPFNGVIYISSYWPGGTGGYGVGGPNEHPFHGLFNMINTLPPAPYLPSYPVAAGQAEPTRTHTAVQQALPQPLCSSLGAGAGNLAGRDFDRHGVPATRARFRVPDCALYNNQAPWPNALRVVNGANLNGVRLPRGISIITNLPTYLVGNFNTSSNVSAANAVPWVSSLVGGDKVILQSNAWSDLRSRWDQIPSAQARIATNTTYNVALLTEPSSTLTSLLEDWSGRDLIVNGSMVYGYNAVYALHDNTCCGNQTYDPPDRTFNFDPHFGLITNQPPGTPVFPVSAVSMWTKAQ